jgi:tetratricopeptide (TPR) repeat protein
MRFQDVLRYVVLAGVFLLPFLPFIVANSMFFPFITGKNFLFRIIVEIIFGAWILLALFDTRFRPTFSWILCAIFLFVASIGVADLFGENVFKSFWSNFERMEGWITLLHLLMYFVVAGSVLTTARLWGWLAHTSVGVSVLICLYGIGQFVGVFDVHQSDVRLDATIGNSAYLAIYLVFHIFITLILMFRWKGGLGSGGWVRYLYLIPVLLQIFILYHTATRGAILGFVGGLLLTALLIAVFERGYTKLRRVAFALLISIVVLIGGFFLVKEMSWVSESPVLSRFANISITDPTVLSRFTIWNMALEGFQERPILGFGQENFNLVFNEYYKPELYDHEQWFDRVHNIILDWLIAGGIVGLLTYLFIPLTFLYYLWRRASRIYFATVERSLWTGLLAAYFFHNLFVFDNILSYLLFFSILAYVHALVGKSLSETHYVQMSPGVIRIAIPFTAMAVGIAMYFFVWQGVATSQALINGLRTQDPNIRLEYLREAGSYNTLGRQEAAEQVLQVALSYAQQEIPAEVRRDMFFLAEEEMRAEIEKSPRDARLRLFLGALYNQYGVLEEAQEQFRIAQELSPNKQSIIIQRANSLFNAGDYAGAQALFREAHELDPSFDEPRILYAVASLYAGDEELSDQLLEGIRQTSSLTGNHFLLNGYANLGRYDKLLPIWLKRIEQHPNNADMYISLAAIYNELGRYQDAVNAIERAIELNPALEEQGAQILQELQTQNI